MRTSQTSWAFTVLFIAALALVMGGCGSNSSTSSDPSTSPTTLLYDFSSSIDNWSFWQQDSSYNATQLTDPVVDPSWAPDGNSIKATVSSVENYTYILHSGDSVSSLKDLSSYNTLTVTVKYTGKSGDITGAQLYVLYKNDTSDYNWCGPAGGTTALTPDTNAMLTLDISSLTADQKKSIDQVGVQFIGGNTGNKANIYVAGVRGKK